MKRREFLDLGIKGGLAALLSGTSILETGCGKKEQVPPVPEVKRGPTISREMLESMYKMEPADLVRAFNGVVHDYHLNVPKFRDERDIVSIVQILHFEQLYYNGRDSRLDFESAKRQLEQDQAAYDTAPKEDEQRVSEAGRNLEESKRNMSVKKQELENMLKEFYTGAQAITDVMLNRMWFTQGSWVLPTIHTGRGIVHDKFGYDWAHLIWWNPDKKSVHGNMKVNEWNCLGYGFGGFFTASQESFSSFKTNYKTPNGHFLDDQVIHVVKKALIDTALGINLNEKNNPKFPDVQIGEYAHPTRFALFYRSEERDANGQYLCPDGWEGNTAFGLYRWYATGYTAVTPDGSGKHTFYGIGLPLGIEGITREQASKLVVIGVDHRSVDNKDEPYTGADNVTRLIVPKCKLDSSKRAGNV